jgi:hypothetical protein
MKMGKQKIIYDKNKSEQKKALRIPFPKPGEDFKDKKKYSRKEKHKQRYETRKS